MSSRGRGAIAALVMEIRPVRVAPCKRRGEVLTRHESRPEVSSARVRQRSARSCRLVAEEIDQGFDLRRIQDATLVLGE